MAEYNIMLKFEEIKTDVLPDWYRVRCQGCGRFVNTKTAKYHFIPDSVCGPEESYWECEHCK